MVETQTTKKDLNLDDSLLEKKCSNFLNSIEIEEDEDSIERRKKDILRELKEIYELDTTKTKKYFNDCADIFCGSIIGNVINNNLSTRLCLNLLDGILELNNKNHKAKVYKGILLRIIGDNEQAIKILNVAYKEDDEDNLLLNELGGYYFELGDKERSNFYYRKIELLGGSMPENYDYKDSLEFMECEKLMKEVGELIKTSRYKKAIDKLDELSESRYFDFNEELINHYLGIAYFMEGIKKIDYLSSDLEEELKQFVDIIPTNNLLLGITYPDNFSFDGTIMKDIEKINFKEIDDEYSEDEYDEYSESTIDNISYTSDSDEEDGINDEDLDNREEESISPEQIYLDEVYKYKKETLLTRDLIVNCFDNAIIYFEKNLGYNQSLMSLMNVRLYLGEYEQIIDFYKNNIDKFEDNSLFTVALAYYQIYRQYRKRFIIEENYFQEYKKIIELMSKKSNEKLLLKYKDIIARDKEEGDKECYSNKIIFYKNVLKDTPNDYETLNNLGDVLYKINNIDEARKYFKRADNAKEGNQMKNKIIGKNIEILTKKILKNQENQIEQDKEHYKLTQNIDSKIDRMLSIISFMDHEILDIKNMRRDDEQKHSLMFSEIEKASKAIKENQSDKLEKYENMLKETIVNRDKMEVLNKENLPVAEYIYDMLNKIPKSDFAAVIIQYCKGLEKELFEKFFSPFVVYIKNHYNEESLNNNLKEDLNNKKSQKFAEQFLYSKPRFALGDMITILQHANNNKKTSQSWLLNQFKQFILKINSHVLEITIKSSQMLDNIINYRNKAAHANEKIDWKVAEDCRKDVPKEINDILDEIK